MGRTKQYDVIAIDRKKEVQDQWYLQRRKEIQDEENDIQAKVEISQPGDRPEREADTIAAQVVQGNKTQQSISPVHSNESVQRKKPEYTPELVQYIAYQIIKQEDYLRNVIKVIQNIDDDTLMKFVAPDGTYRPRVKLTEKRNAGGTIVNLESTNDRQLIKLNPAFTFADAVITYLHEINHYIDGWMAGGAGAKNNLWQQRDENGQGVGWARPTSKLVFLYLVNRSSQREALGELLTFANDDFVNHMMEPILATDTKRAKMVKRKYRRWSRFGVKNIDEKMRDWLDKEAGNAYGDNIRIDDNHQVSTNFVELGYVFEKSLFFSDPTNEAVGSDWPAKYNDWFKQKYGAYLILPAITKLLLGLKSENANGSDASPGAGFSSTLSSTKGSGQSLDHSTKSEMESKIGSDFSSVRIHNDSTAHQLSENVNAKAFTHEQDVYFKSGNYNPSSSAGKELLAHELVHTVQQTGGIQRKDDTDPDAQKFKEDNQLVKDVWEVVTAVLSGSDIDVDKIQTKSVRDGAEDLIRQAQYKKADQPHRRLIAYYFIRTYAPNPNDRVRVIERKSSSGSTPKVQGEFDYLPVELLNAPDAGFNNIPAEQRKIQNEEQLKSLESSLSHEGMKIILERSEIWTTPDLLALMFALLNATGAAKDPELLQIIDTHKNDPPSIQALIAQRENLVGPALYPILLRLLKLDYTWTHAEILYSVILLAKLNSAENNPDFREAIDARKSRPEEAQEVLDMFGYDDHQFNLFPKILDLLQDPATWQDQPLLDLTLTMVEQMNMALDPAIFEAVQKHRNDSAFSNAVAIKHGYVGYGYQRPDLMKQSLTGGSGTKVGIKYAFGRRKYYGKKRFGLILNYLGLKRKASVENLNVDHLQDQMGGTLYGMQFMNAEEFEQSDMAKGWKGNSDDSVSQEYIEQAGIIQEITHDRKKNLMIVKAKFLPFASINEVWGDSAMRSGPGWFKDVELVYHWTDGEKKEDDEGHKYLDIASAITAKASQVRISNMQYVSPGTVYGIGNIESDNIEALMQQHRKAKRRFHKKKQGEHDRPDKLTGAKDDLKETFTDLTYVLMYTAMGNVNKFMPDIQPEANAKLVEKLFASYRSVDNWHLKTGRTKVENVVSSADGLLLKEAEISTLEFFVRPQIVDGVKTGKYVYGFSTNDLNVKTGGDTDQMVSQSINDKIGGKTDIIVKGLAQHAKRVTAEGVIGQEKGVETMWLHVQGFEVGSIAAKPLDVQTDHLTVYSSASSLTDISSDFKLKLDYTQMKQPDDLASAVQEFQVENLLMKKAVVSDFEAAYKGAMIISSETNEEIVISDMRLDNLLIKRDTPGDPLKVKAIEGGVGGFTSRGDITSSIPGIFEGTLSHATAMDVDFKIANGELRKLKASYLGVGGYNNVTVGGKAFVQKGGQVAVNDLDYEHSDDITKISVGQVHNLPAKGIFLDKLISEGDLLSGDLENFSVTLKGREVQEVKAQSIYYAGSFKIHPSKLGTNQQLGAVSFIFNSTDFSMTRDGENYVFKNVHFDTISCPFVSIGGLGKSSMKVQAEKATIQGLTLDFTIMYEQGVYKGFMIDKGHIDKISGRDISVDKVFVMEQNRTASISNINIDGVGMNAEWNLIGKPGGTITTGKIDVPKFTSSILENLLFVDYKFEATGTKLSFDENGNVNFVITKPDLTLLVDDHYKTEHWYVLDTLKKGGVIGADEIGITFTPDYSLVGGYVKNPAIRKLKLYHISKPAAVPPAGAGATQELLGFIEVDAKIEGRLNIKKGKSRFGLFDDIEKEKDKPEKEKSIKEETSWVIESDAPLKITHLKFDQEPEEKEDPDRAKIRRGVTGTVPLVLQTRDSVNYFDMFDTSNGTMEIQLFGGSINLNVTDGFVHIDNTISNTLGTILDTYISGFPDSPTIPDVIRDILAALYDAPGVPDILVDQIFGDTWLINIINAIRTNTGMRAIGDQARLFATNNLEISDRFQPMINLLGYPLDDAGTGRGTVNSIDDMWVKFPLMESEPGFYRGYPGNMDLRVSRLINYQYLKDKNSGEQGAEDVANLRYLEAKVGVKDLNTTDFTALLAAQLDTMLARAILVATSYITDPFGDHEDFFRDEDIQLLKDRLAGWSGALFEKLLMDNLKFRMNLTGLKFTEKTGELGTRLLNGTDETNAKGTMGRSDVQNWRETTGSIDMGLSTTEKFSVTKVVFPGFAYLNADKDMKINIGATTIGANSNFIAGSHKDSRHMEMNSPDITISGLKIELKRKEK